MVKRRWVALALAQLVYWVLLALAWLNSSPRPGSDLTLLGIGLGTLPTLLFSWAVPGPRLLVRFVPVGVLVAGSLIAFFTDTPEYWAVFVGMAVPLVAAAASRTGRRGEAGLRLAVGFVTMVASWGLELWHIGVFGPLFWLHPFLSMEIASLAYLWRARHRKSSPVARATGP